MLLPEPPVPGMPIFYENSPQSITDQILWLVKHANLDFQIKETPFSLNLSLKKKFAQHWNSNLVYNQQNQGTFTPAHSFTAPMSAHIKPGETFQEFPQKSPQSHHETENLKNLIKDLKQEKEALEKEVVN